MYQVLLKFRDGNPKAEGHIYEIGDEYPVSKYAGSLTKARITELTKAEGPNDSFDGPVIAEIDK